MLSRDSARVDWIAGGLLFALTLALIFFRIDAPPVISFDEAHYVPAARDLLTLTRHNNTEHPLLAKETIALGIMLFGDNAFGWRALGALILSCAVPSIFGLCRMLGLSRISAIFAALLLLLDQTLFVMARTAMLDPHSVGWFCLFMVTLAWSAQPRRSLMWAVIGLAVSGVFLGFAGAAKWMSLINGFIVWFGVMAWRLLTPDGYSLWGERIYRPSEKAWPRITPLLAPAICGLFAIIAYFSVFWPLFFLKEGGVHDVGGFLQAQVTIYQRSALPLAHHPYQSLWWEWPFQWQPIWFYFKDAPTNPNMVEAVFYVGSFVVYWGGFFAVLACLVRGIIRMDSLLLAIAAAFLAFWLVWAVIPKKIGFLYYYAPASLMLGPAIAAVIERIVAERWRTMAMGIVGFLALANFAWYYPGLSGLAVPKDTWGRWVIAKHWIAGRPDPSAKPSASGAASASDTVTEAAVEVEEEAGGQLTGEATGGQAPQ
jgi:dolichyl-phosphate-mannose--protein O-mannosyl transferase